MTGASRFLCNPKKNKGVNSSLLILRKLDLEIERPRPHLLHKSFHKLISFNASQYLVCVPTSFQKHSKFECCF